MKRDQQPESRRPNLASAAGIRPKWIWHHRTLLELRERLQQACGEQLAAVAQPLEPHSLAEADSATDEFDHNLALSALAAERDALLEIEEALHRIRNRTYGICLETGQPIPAARLRAVPWTRYSKAVAERLEHEGVLARAHLGAVASVHGSGPFDLSGVETDPDNNPKSAAQDETLNEVVPPAGRILQVRVAGGRNPKRVGPA